MDYQEAFNCTNPDPAAYGIPPGEADTEERLKKARETAALNLLAGATANQVYWDSRTELESLAAQARGHGGIGVPPDQPGAPADAEVVESGSADHAGELTTGTGEPAPTPENPVEAVAKLRAQVASLGGTPEA